MLTSVIRFAKRLAILVPGLAVAYVSIFNIFPELNDRLPAVAAAIFTYLLAAYVIIPAIIRLVRILFPPQHLPLYCVTPDGFASDPLNIGIIGTRQQVRQAMLQVGWHEADKLNLRTAIRAGLSTIYRWSYPTAPMSSLFLFGRRQDLSFQIPITEGAHGSRHHVRFWAADFNEDKRLSVRSINWQQRQTHVRDDRLLWVGAASRDIGVTFIRHNAQLTHLVDPNTNAERDLIVAQLGENGLAKVHRTIKLDNPYKLRNIRGWYGHLLSDGRMTILELTGRTSSQDSTADRHPPKPRLPVK